MKFYLKSFLSWSSLPLVVGIVLGWMYQYASSSARLDIESGIAGFSNQYVFELFAFINLILVSMYVLVKGLVVEPFNKFEKFIFYWLPATAFGFVVPFFGATYGFIIGHPLSPNLINLAILGIFALIWSVGFYLLLLAPAHANLPPQSIKAKRQLYSAILFSTVAVFLWNFVT